MHVCLTLQTASQELILAAMSGELSKVKGILCSGAVYVDVVDCRGRGALYAAAVSLHIHILP